SQRQRVAAELERQLAVAGQRQLAQLVELVELVESRRIEQHEPRRAGALARLELLLWRLARVLGRLARRRRRQAEVSAPSASPCEVVGLHGSARTERRRVAVRPAENMSGLPEIDPARPAALACAPFGHPAKHEEL